MSGGPSLFREALSSMELVAGIVLLVIGSVLFSVTGQAFLHERAYRHGVHADAVVIRKHMRPATSDSSTAYELTYRASTPGGAEWHGTESVDVAIWERVEEGGTLRVQYVPGDPGSLRLTRRNWDGLLGAAAALTAALALVGLSLFSRGARLVARRMRLYRHGQPVEATVTSVHETNVSINRQIQWAVAYEFEDHLGHTQQGSSAPMPAGQALEWHEGDKGIARFDPQQPADSVWVAE
jgi:hypothetical protein